MRFIRSVVIGREWESTMEDEVECSYDVVPLRCVQRTNAITHARSKVSYNVRLQLAVASPDSILQRLGALAAYNESLSYPNIFHFKPCQNFIVE